MNTKISVILILIISLVLSGCGQGQEATLIPPISASSTVTEATAQAIHTPLPEAVDLLAEAFSYSQQGEDAKSIETYTKAIEADPLFGQPYINRGAVYADIGELKKALADFNKGLELDPTNLRGYTNRAQAYIQLDKLDEALADINSVVNLTDDDEYVKTALSLGGSVYEIRGETFLALAAYSKALEIDEFFIPALIARGQIYFHQEDWLRAFSDLTLALQTTKDPGIQQAIVNILMGVYPEGTTVNDATASSKVYFDQAMEYKNKGDFKGSTEPLSKAIEIDPLNSDYYYERSLNLADSGELEKAITDMSYVIALDPMNARGYFYRGLIEADYNMVTEAIADLEKVRDVLTSADARATANQKLEDLRPRLELCQFTSFEAVNDAKDPTFLFTFQGPPNTDFVSSAFNRNPVHEADGVAMFAITPKNGVTPTGIEYKLHEGETTPIELDISIAFSGCQLRKTAIWPHIDILALLSESNP
jgi:tetratricopeptide (TPR) repeat protein